MTIYLNFLDSGGAGREIYPNMRHAYDPPPYSFTSEQEFFRHEEVSQQDDRFSNLQRPERSPEDRTVCQSQASVYEFVRSWKEGDDMIWDYKLFRFMSHDEAIEWMREKVSGETER